MKHVRNILAWLGRIFRKAAPLPAPGPDERIYIAQAEVIALAKKALHGKVGLGFLTWLPDAWYYCPSLQYVRRLLAVCKVDQRQYKSGAGDCDDFAKLLHATFVDDAWRDGQRRNPHCAGQAHGLFPKPHAINWVITDDHVFRFIEPQTDAVFLPNASIKETWRLMS